jgi:tetratricopeptide (TPR) repeat protein
MLADAYTMKQSALLLEGRFQEVLEIARKSLRLSQSIRNVWNQLTAFYYLTAAYTEQGEVRLALETSAENLQLVEETGFTMFLPGVLRHRLTLYLDSGGLDQAKSLASELYQIREEIVPIFRPHTMALIIRTKIAGNELEQARRVLEEAYHGLDLDESPIIYTSYLLLAEIHLLLALDDAERALERADYLVERMRQAGFRQLLPEALWLQGKAKISLSQLEPAHLVLREALTVSQEVGERRVRWQILGSLAELQARRGNASGAEEWRDQAGEVLGFIADRSPPNLHGSFLARPDVRAITEHAPIGEI